VYASALVSGAASLYFLISALMEAPLATDTSMRMLYGYLLGFGTVNVGLACMLLQERPHPHHVPPTSTLKHIH
jgi:hypothetical protein